MSNSQSAVNNFSLRIIHPVHEHSSGGLLAFKHALALALAACGELEIIDIRNTPGADYEAFSVRAVLEKWGILPPNSERSDVGKLGLKVTKIVKKGEAKKIIAHRMEKHEHDMLVIGTHERHGLNVLFGQDLAEHLANAFRQTTLYVPAKARPFVNPDTGEVTLKNILIPVAQEPSADLSFHFLQMLLHIFHRDSAEVIGLHCGDASKSLERGETFPALPPPAISGIVFKEVCASEPVVAAIANAARSCDADLIIMTTQGRNTLPKKIMGSITEQVLHASTCPVLSIPVM
jgi:nucleotide-binding universal stress UspA family protein